MCLSGVPELFLSIFAPANYMETVSTLGLPYYAKRRVMPFNRAWLVKRSRTLHVHPPSAQSSSW